MNIQENMRDKGTKKMTCEDALRRLEEARRLKREYVKELEKKMKEDFKKRTGQDATYFEVWELLILTILILILSFSLYKSNYFYARWCSGS